MTSRAQTEQWHTLPWCVLDRAGSDTTHKRPYNPHIHCTQQVHWRKSAHPYSAITVQFAGLTRLVAVDNVNRWMSNGGDVLHSEYFYENLTEHAVTWLHLNKYAHTPWLVHAQLEAIKRICISQYLFTKLLFAVNSLSNIHFQIIASLLMQCAHSVNYASMFASPYFIQYMCMKCEHKYNPAICLTFFLEL